MRIALGIEYDGSRFCGWQTQPSGCAVQDCLDGVLSRIAAQPVLTQCAGRTDAGVHALGQVVHFDTDARRPLTAWVRGANTLLPRSCAVLWAREVEPAFHARFCARGRAYLYVLLNRRERPGLFAEHAGWHHHDLDIARMREAAASMLGTHDFSAFRAAECQARSPVKTLRGIDIEQRGAMFVFHLAADAFLHHMVRNIVGSLVRVGNGSRPASWMREILEGRDRTRAAPTFAAGGLYLAQVEYDAQWNLPASATSMAALCTRLPFPALMEQ
ncbi:MAG: tRNA pseudouridine(38-40) synthase TruA [Burkholderiales bacterium]|nr:tRNA pseudouridine(38-40) synthase TruA [Burkholderiales bacterium]